ncbi:MAG: acetoin utilization deacetylase AcuC-like enzyme [Planctomycetota bacterium]|jgi:acetoin utilization deacetylase AcuC-like enzyme
MSRAATGLVTNESCLDHQPGAGHPERSDRIHAVLGRLNESGLTSQLSEHAGSMASLESIALVHPPEFIEHVRARIDEGADWVDASDANVCVDSFRAALASAGGLLDATDRVATRAWDNALALVRPPGHHAERAQAMGFCLFNNAAIAARHLQAKHGIERVAIVDWDVHHGNGTQHIFEQDPSVLYASLHQYPHYPGTGSATERGIGEGVGYTLNCPMAPGSGDDEWLAAFEERVLVAVDDFRPEFLIISAGFDAHVLDPLSETRVTEATYARMTHSLLELARTHCDGKLVSVLEGGYHLDGLARSAEAHVGALVQ